ncbi:MAG TPA: hypothetical protein VD969_20655 [Symbiobacteriaceae bacterium]|nr:hypothetical protein [Symbiobacteriaceae bacterium]
MANGIGRSIGYGLVGAVFGLLAVQMAARTTPRDIADVKQILNNRAKAAG